MPYELHMTRKMKNAERGPHLTPEQETRWSEELGHSFAPLDTE